MRHSLAAVFVICASGGLLAPCTSIVAAQAPSTARLLVTVKDNWGVLPGATVRAIQTGAQSVVRATAGPEGRVALDGLLPGTYELRASLPGFAEAVRPDVVVTAGGQHEVELVLELLEFSTTVTVTTANRREELLLDVANPTTLIERAQIEDTAARTAKDLLLDQAGTGILVQPGGGQGHVTLNGIPNSGVLVLVDGRRYLGRDALGQFNLEDLELTGVERLEVVKGAGSALYGSDALGGVINIITRKSTARGWSDTAGFTAGSYGDVRVSNVLGYRGTPGGLTFSTGYRTYDGFDLDKTNPQTIGQPESQFQTVGLNADYRFSDRIRSSLVSSYNGRDIDNYFFSGATQLASSVYNSTRDIARYTVSPDVDVLFSPNTSANVTLNLGRYDREETQTYVNVDRVVQVPTWQERNTEVKATAMHTWRAWAQPHVLQGGYEHRDERLERGSLRIPGTNDTATDRDIDVLWVQQELSLGATVKATAGFRYDDYSDFGSAWSPKLSVVFAPTGAQRLRASFGEGFRAPLFGELYLYTPPFFVGNPDLDPERSNTWTVGYAWNSVRLQASADYFHNRVKDGIVFDFSTTPFTYANLRQYDSQGVNTAVSLNLPFGFVPSFAYSYVERQDAEGREVGGLPKNAGTVKLLWTIPRYGIRANLRGQLNDDILFEDETSQPAYQVWYAQVSKRFTRGETSFNVFAQVDNLFDETDIFRRSAQGEPIPGDFLVWQAPRTLLAGVTVDLAWLK